MPDFYDLLVSGCDRVYLVNCEVGKRVSCGFAFVDAHSSDEIILFANNKQVATILLPQDMKLRSQPIFISSPQDNLEFQLKP